MNLFMFCLLKVLNSSRSPVLSPTSRSSSMPSLTAVWLVKLTRARKMLFWWWVCPWRRIVVIIAAVIAFIFHVCHHILPKWCFNGRSWKGASPTTWSSFSVTAAASTAPFTPTRRTRRRWSSSRAQGRAPSATRWSTSCTSTAQTASSSLSSPPRLCQSASTHWPSTTTSGRSKDQ